MAASIKVKLDLPKADEIIKTCGLSESGDTQKFHTSNVLRRMTKYMPFKSGALIKITAINSTSTEISTVAPQAAMLYYGKVMVDSETGVAGFLTNDGWKSRKGSTKVVTDRDLQFDTSKNPKAGPFWDKRMVAEEGDVLVQELQEYFDKKAGKS